jgi:hypothetical protein
MLLEMKDIMKTRTAICPRRPFASHVGGEACLRCGNLRFRTGKYGFLIRNAYES